MNELREISGRAVPDGPADTGIPAAIPYGLVDRFNFVLRPMPVPHDPATGEPTDEGCAELERVWGIRRPS